LIQTVDFFTPIVDDPRTFGRIAAANSLSDVYAMGGKPLTVMNMVCFPIKTMPIEVLQEILKGGLDTTQEAGAVLVGGHTVEDEELKYGLSVAGTVHPSKVITNSGARTGDAIVLTKPLGTGIISTAVKKDAASGEVLESMIKSMVRLNRQASEAMIETGVNACTDVTGFGLLGHAMEMATASGVGMELEAGKVPYLEGAVDYTAKKMAPGGTKANCKHFGTRVNMSPGLKEWAFELLFDPQTSGGLLISVLPEKTEKLLSALKKGGDESACVIGRCIKSPAGRIEIL